MTACPLRFVTGLLIINGYWVILKRIWSLFCEAESALLSREFTRRLYHCYFKCCHDYLQTTWIISYLLKRSVHSQFRIHCFIIIQSTFPGLTKCHKREEKETEMPSFTCNAFVIQGLRKIVRKYSCRRLWAS